MAQPSLFSGRSFVAISEQRHLAAKLVGDLPIFFPFFLFSTPPLETTVFFVLFSKEKDAHCVGASPKPRACGGYLDSSFLVDILSTCGLSTDILVLPRDTNAAFRGACQTRSSESWQRSWDHRDPQGTYSVRRSRCSLAVSLRFLGNIGVVKIDLNN